MCDAKAAERESSSRFFIAVSIASVVHAALRRRAAGRYDGMLHAVQTPKKPKARMQRIKDRAAAGLNAITEGSSVFK